MTALAQLDHNCQGFSPACYFSPARYFNPVTYNMLNQESQFRDSFLFYLKERKSNNEDLNT